MTHSGYTEQCVGGVVHSRQHRRAAWVPVNMEDEPDEEDSLVSGRSTPDDERQWSNDVDSNT